MKTALQFVGFCLASLLLAGIAIAYHRHKLDHVQQENQALRRQVNGLSAQSDQLAAEKAQLALLLAIRQTNPGAALPPEPSNELLRLRGEVGRLRVQEIAVEQERRDQMLAARAKLTNAEVELARLTKLHSAKLVSSAELGQAKFTVELLKAEARGDAAEAARVRKLQAEEELARATELRNQSLISQAEYEQAVRKVETVRAAAR